MPGVVGQGVDPLLAQELRRAVDLGARQAIDDAALALVARQELEELLLSLVPLDDGVGDVGPVETLAEDRRLAEPQALDDVGAGQRDRRSR